MFTEDRVLAREVAGLGGTLAKRSQEQMKLAHLTDANNQNMQLSANQDARAQQQNTRQGDTHKSNMKNAMLERTLKATSIASDMAGSLAFIDDPAQFKQASDYLKKQPIIKFLDADGSGGLMDLLGDQEGLKSIAPMLRGYSQLYKEGQDAQEKALAANELSVKIAEMQRKQSNADREFGFKSSVKKREFSNEDREFGMKKDQFLYDAGQDAIGNRQKDQQIEIDRNKKGMNFRVDRNGDVQFSSGGSGANVDENGNVSATRSVNTSLQNDVIGGTETLALLDGIDETFNEESLTYAGKAGIEGARFLDKTPLRGLGVGKEELKANAKFESNVRQFFNAYRKEITGAAAAVQEMEELQRSIISMKDSPTEFKAKKQELRKKTQRMLRIKRKMLREGINVNGENFGKQFDNMWLGGVDDDPRVRMLEVKDDFLRRAKGDKAKAKAMAIQHLRQTEGYNI